MSNASTAMPPQAGRAEDRAVAAQLLDEDTSSSRGWKIARAWSIIVAVVIAWEVVARVGMFPPVILPAFSDVLASLYHHAVTGDLWRAVSWSLYRVLLGFGIGLCLAIPLGIAIGWSPICADLFNPIVEVLRPIPPLAWIPLAVIWLGIGMASVLFIVVLGAFFPIIVATIAGVRNVDKRAIEFARTLGANTWQILLKVVIPAALPQAFVGMRIAIGFSWMTVVAAEMISVKWGLGWMIWQARFSFETETVIAGMAVIGVLSVIMSKSMIWMENVLFSWKKGLVKG